MAQKEERILKDWQDYVDDYSTKLSVLKTETDAIINSSTATAAEKQNAQRDYELQKAHLEELQTKLSSLQTYYAQHGELPDDVTFDGGKLGSFRYKTAADSDWFTGYARNLPPGSVYISAQHFSLVIEAWGTGGTWGAYNGTNQNWFGIWNEGYVSWAGYHAYDQKNYMTPVNYDSGSWSSHTFLGCNVSTSLSDDVIPANTYAALSHTFTNGIIIEMPSDTVPTDSPWDYYNDDIVPNLEDPDNNIYPGGYEPPGPGTDPDDGPEEELAPDKTDWGEPDEPWGDFYPFQDFNNYAAFNAVGIEQLKISLWDSPDGFWNALSILGSNSANYLDYLVSLRVYPYDISVAGDYDTLYLGRGGQLTLPGGEGAYTNYGIPMKVTIFPFEIKAEKYYNNFLDFAPYTKAELYLPFSGTWEINPKYVYHTTLKIYLFLDITDGSGVWEVYNAEHSKRILLKQCKIGIELPLSGSDAIGQSSQIVNATLGLAQTVTGGVPRIAGSVLSAVATGANKEATMLDAVGAGIGVASQLSSTGLDIFSAATNLANANREMPCYTGGTTGLAAAQQSLFPTLTLIRPVVENPSSFPHTVGHLVNQASKLEDLTGFTTCRNVDVSNVPQAIDREKAELKTILENGFYA